MATTVKPLEDCSSYLKQSAEAPQTTADQETNSWASFTGVGVATQPLRHSYLHSTSDPPKHPVSQYGGRIHNYASSSSSGPNQPVTELRAGFHQKQFSIPTALLLENSQLFAILQSQLGAVLDSDTLHGPYLFSDLDPFSFSLFEHWIRGRTLDGPSGFFSMNHYLGLYVLAQKFQIEKLCNTTMDLIRGYYREKNMTAPPFRLEYVYKHTSRPCLMRDFLVATAAHRALTSGKGPEGISPSMKKLLYEGGDLAQDYCTALCKLATKKDNDVRNDKSCDWHEHNQTSSASCALLELRVRHDI